MALNIRCWNVEAIENISVGIESVGEFKMIIDCNGTLSRYVNDKLIYSVPSKFKLDTNLVFEYNPQTKKMTIKKVNGDIVIENVPNNIIVFSQINNKTIIEPNNVTYIR